MVSQGGQLTEKYIKYFSFCNNLNQSQRRVANTGWHLDFLFVSGNNMSNFWKNGHDFLPKNLENFEKYWKFRKILKISKNLENFEKSWKFRKILKISQNLENFEKSWKFRKILKISKNLENFEKSWKFWKFRKFMQTSRNRWKFREIAKISRNCQNSEKSRKFREIFSFFLIQKFHYIISIWFWATWNTRNVAIVCIYLR